MSLNVMDAESLPPEPSNASAEVDDDAEFVDGHIEPERRVTLSGRFSGPLPPPDVLQSYDEIEPGLKREIIDQWKAETAHRRKTVDYLNETDREAMRAFNTGETRGQWLGFVVMLGVLALVAFAILEDEPLIGIAGILAGAATAVTAIRRPPQDLKQEPVDLGDGNEIERVEGRDKAE